ncbi:glycosyltransferase [Aquidulcibacter sp.]|jgi:glycosyltransferase involved in cell wall biosynthesis|uniref:glycosyltransferase n=1 Tax=Aquidulcibacter sp. TaxID=2052990 RepID=UPI003BA79B43
MALDGALRLIYVGQIRYEKGVSHLIEAVSILLNEGQLINLTLVGPTGGWTHDDFPDQIIKVVQANPLLSDSVQFIGYVEDVRGRFVVSDVHVAPSIFEEPFGLVVIEAKSAGIPSIVYPSGGLVELISDGVDGIVCTEKSPDALVVAIRSFLSEPGRIKEFGDSAKSSLERIGCTDAAFQDAWYALIRQTPESQRI